MKTKIRTQHAICALGFIGLINIHAITDNKKLVNSEVINEKVEMVSNESWSSEKTLIYSAEVYSILDFNGELDQFAANQILSEVDALTDESSLYSAKAFTAIDSENEIESYESNQIIPEVSGITNPVELKSAEFFTASGADREIEKYVRKQVSMQQIRTRK